MSVHGTADDADMATMTIGDNGGGFKAKLDSKHHGLGLVRRLVEQVRGTAMVVSDIGTIWTIEVPLSTKLRRLG
ncbi:MAG: hypothetical protein ABI150_07945 [Nitrobacter sp.]